MEGVLEYQEDMDDTVCVVDCESQLEYFREMGFSQVVTKEILLNSLMQLEYT